MNIQQELFNQANAHQSTKEFKKAIDYYLQLLALNSSYPQAQHFLGLCYAQRGQMQKALSHLEKALQQETEDASLFNHLATVYKFLEQFKEAEAFFKKAVALEPQYAEAHNNLASLYAGQKNYQQALIHYKKAVHAAPDFTTAHYNLGLLLLKMENKEAALTQFHNVISLSSEHIDVHFYLGLLYLENNQLEKAKTAFLQLLKFKPEDVETLCNLGVIAVKNEENQLAIEYFTKALALDIEHEYARNNLAAIFIHHDRFENALRHYHILISKYPQNLEYQYNAGVAEMALGHLEKAIAYFNTVLKYEDNHWDSLVNLATINIKLNNTETAINFLIRANSINPNNESVQHLLNALTKMDLQPKTKPEYAKNLFNNYALYYDNHMQEQLKYTLPTHIEKLIELLSFDKKINSLDLGCGTGLIGALLKKLNTFCIGVDIAPKMLEQAKSKNNYDLLVCDEAIHFLEQNKQKFDLIIAADLLPYFGELNLFFSQINARLAQNGYFIFSTEISEVFPWQIQNTARFSHHENYLKTLCDKFSLTIISQQQVFARVQDGQSLAVFLWMCKRC